MFYTDAADKTATVTLNSSTCPTCGHVGGHHDSPRAGCDCCACTTAATCPAWCEYPHGTDGTGVHVGPVLSSAAALVDAELIEVSTGPLQPGGYVFLGIVADDGLLTLDQARAVAAALVQAADLAETGR